MDLGSTNGTLVNNSDIDREELKDGDKIAFGPILAQFKSGARRAAGNTGQAKVPAAAPAGRAPVGMQSVPPGFAPGADSGRSQELELELNTLKARYSTLEKEIDKVRGESAENERRVAEHAVSNMKAEMEKLRTIVRERDESMRVVEAQSKERENWMAPEEVERERKRIEQAVQLDSKRQIDAYERQVRDLEQRMVAKAAEAAALQKTVKERDDQLARHQETSQSAGSATQELTDRIAALGADLKRVQDELLDATSREKEANEKLKQKTGQVTQLMQAQADLTAQVAKARASAMSAMAGDASAASAASAQALAELETTKQQLLDVRSQLGALQDEAIGLRSRADAESSRAASAQKAVDDLHTQLTDLADEKSRLSQQNQDFQARLSALSGMEAQLAAVQAVQGNANDMVEQSRARIQELESALAAASEEKHAALSDKAAAEQRLGDVEADYKVLRSSRDATFDWEARYKSQVDEMESLRRKNDEMSQTMEVLSAQAALATGGGVDESVLTYAKSRGAIFEEMAAGLVDGVNNAVSLLRRNSEVLKGYVNDCGLLANCVRQINYTLLEPEQQRMIRELVDETQPDVIVRNMESIGEENAEATNRAKRLILDFQEAVKTDEEGSELERCFAKSQGLVKAVDPSSQVRVKVSSALPTLPVDQTSGVLFAYTLLREAQSLAVDEDSAPNIRVEVAPDKTITLMAGPVKAAAKEKYRETNAGSGGDSRSQFIVGFARKACNGRVDVKDMGDASTMFITLSAK